ncbi:Uma2 family endonuclease [Thiospirillum jenense]|uniref:Uma2 family endonuclease n=1 Tax=Thiospirillum jenense TaxID=1653858 RepID=A0A839HL52_9GAMM|nr:Uma2 family endonuclease [Thiospirillum jenense]MBB1126442.1 Uma2 family endonuclease [Thiospirillum jenense]
MQWSEVIADTTLADLPYKIEMNEWGKIEMSPATNFHSGLQMEIAVLLRELLKDGKSYAEISIETAKNVKVADVVWASNQFLSQYGLETPYHVAPEICVEVMSPSNTEREMLMKTELYLERGAQEVWICLATGQLRFFTSAGQQTHSPLCPDFPTVIQP